MCHLAVDVGIGESVGCTLIGRALDVTMTSQTISLTDVSPMLKVSDLDETIAFYTDVLGFSLKNRMEHWCSLGCGAVEIMFYDHNEHQSGLPQMTGVLYFNPTDVKALWESVKDKAAIEWELQTMFYDMVEFAIRDCNGYTLAFGQDVRHVTPPLPPRRSEG